MADQSVLGPPEVDLEDLSIAIGWYLRYGEALSARHAESAGDDHFWREFFEVVGVGFREVKERAGTLLARGGLLEVESTPGTVEPSGPIGAGPSWRSEKAEASSPLIT